jgi:arylsulfatase A
MPRFLLSALLCAAVAVPAAAAEPSRPSGQTRRPNVLFILVDDLGYECLTCNGGTSYQTPNVDALAKSGVRFTRAYCTPLCSPSRVQLMTGRYGFRTGWTKLIESDRDFLDPKERTFGHQLRDANYRTGIAGKWQLAYFPDHPDHLKQCGFDESCLWTWMWEHKRSNRYWAPSIWQEGKLRPDLDKKYGPDVFTDYAIDFFRRHKDEPFFFYYPMVLVHAPWERTPDSPGTPKAGENDKKWFADMVARMDRDVGRLLKALDDLGLRENTIIMFTGDNGTDARITSRMGDVVVPGGKGKMTHIGTHAMT